MSRARPPRLATRIVRAALPSRGDGAYVADLDERFERFAERYGERSARRWYWRQALGFGLRVPAARLSDAAQRTRAAGCAWPAATLARHLAYAVRTLKSRPGFTIPALIIQAGRGTRARAASNPRGRRERKALAVIRRRQTHHVHRVPPGPHGLPAIRRADRRRSDDSRSGRSRARGGDRSTPALTEIYPLDTLLAQSLTEERFYSRLLGSFGLVAFGLAGLGIYGSVAYSVRLRMREIGIRVAFGAQPGVIWRLVVGQGMAPVIVGIGVGCAGAAQHVPIRSRFSAPTDRGEFFAGSVTVCSMS